MSTRSERSCAFVTSLAVLSPIPEGSESKINVAMLDSTGRCSSSGEQKKSQKPLFRPAADDTKPVLRDPISRSDPVEEQATLRLPPFP